MRLLVAGCAVAIAAACGYGRSTAPPGFVDACYGGRENMQRFVAFSDRRVAITIDATEKDWPALTDAVRQVAGQHGLQFFDTSESGPSLRAVMVYACHASGIMLSLDKRIFTAAPEPENRRDKVEVTLYTYRPDVPFEPVARSLETRLLATWRERAKVEQFPAVLPARKALPDVVRAQLIGECSAAPVPKPYYCEGF